MHEERVRCAPGTALLVAGCLHANSVLLCDAREGDLCRQLRPQPSILQRGNGTTCNMFGYLAGIAEEAKPKTLQSQTSCESHKQLPIQARTAVRAALFRWHGCNLI